ncbi:MAG: carboxy terminal-processing peptidase [SAR324 cluster bacterium]|nr:carboxy terminal-processing peptidase [SAR324 cluster bacterium]
MRYKFLPTLIACFLLLFQSCSIEAKQVEAPLTGRSVAQIVHRFTSMHYSQYDLDDNISKRMFKAYLSRLDPGHYYFLDSDIKEFRKFETRLDDLLRQGNVELPLHIFTRFKTRLSERLELIKSFEKEKFDFKKDASWEIDRKNAPYPTSIEEAKKLWRTRFKFDLLTLKLGGNSEKEAKERLIRRANSAWKNYSQYTDNDVIALYLNALTSAFDPHSTYMAPHDQKNFEINIKLSLEGIGAVLRWEDGYTIINSIVAGGAAFREGTLKVNDRIIAVAQGEQPFENVVDMRLNEVVQLIRGKRGTTVRLQFLRKTKSGDKLHTVAIVREKIILKDGESKAYTLTPETMSEDDVFQAPHHFKIGLIHLPSFYTDFEGRRNNPYDYKSASRDVKKQLMQFNQEKVDGLVLDLRDNGGGGLDEAVSMVGLFVGKKPAVVIRNSVGRQEIKKSRENKVYDGPLLVLLSQYSASASEILAGALQDYERAILVGDRATFGKGTVQNISKLSPKYGALKVTIAQFYRVAGGSTQNKGVEPDIVLPSLNNVWEIGEAHLENALPWKTIKPLRYSRDRKLQNHLSKLKKLSEERMKTNEEFIKIEKDIDDYLTTIKPRKYTTIFELQEDFEKNEKRRKDRKKEIDQTLSDAKEDDGGNNVSEEETIKPDEEKDESGFDYAGKNIYLEESIFILEDYIRLLQQGNSTAKVAH